MREFRDYESDMGKGVMIRNGSVRDRKTKWETSDMNAFRM